MGFVPALALGLLVWAADSRSTAAAADVVRFLLDGWLLANGVTIPVDDGARIGLPPLAWSAFIVWRLIRAGRYTARATGARTRADVLRVTATIAVVYAGLGVAAAWYGRVGSIEVSLPIAALTTGTLAFVSAGVGAARATGHDATVWQRCPEWLRRGFRFGLVSAVSLLSVGALAAGVAVLAAGERVTELYRLGNPGVVGAVGLLVLCVLYVPTAAIWGLGYLLGVGFGVGGDAMVSPFHVDAGPVPALPLLASAPATPVPLAGYSGWATVGIIGLVVGFALARRRAPCWPGLAACGVTVVSCGALLLALGWLTRGPLGAAELATIGPHPVLLAGAGAGIILIGLAVGFAIRVVGASLRQPQQTAESVAPPDVAVNPAGPKPAEPPAQPDEPQIQSDESAASPTVSVTEQI